MWDGCVGIVLGFDTKDGCDWFAVGSRLRGGLRTVEDWFSRKGRKDRKEHEE